MPDYLLRNIDRTLWEQFKKRAKTSGLSLRHVLIELIRKFIKQGL